MTFFCIKGFGIQTNKRMATSASLYEGTLFYFYAESEFSLLFLFIFLFGKYHVVRNDLGTYIQLDMGGHELLLLNSPLRSIRWEAKL